MDEYKSPCYECNEEPRDVCALKCRRLDKFRKFLDQFSHEWPTYQGYDSIIGFGENVEEMIDPRPRGRGIRHNRKPKNNKAAPKN